MSAPQAKKNWDRRAHLLMKIAKISAENAAERNRKATFVACSLHRAIVSARRHRLVGLLLVLLPRLLPTA